jgi:hypothetical protein
MRDRENLTRPDVGKRVSEPIERSYDSKLDHYVAQLQRAREAFRKRRESALDSADREASRSDGERAAVSARRSVPRT